MCLDNYKETHRRQRQNDEVRGDQGGDQSQTAGQIIATVGKACGISPKAILVILQKEQSLVTSRTPSARAFQASMGAGCPDTAPCDGKYAGFYANVYYGASLLKGYTLTTSSTYYALRGGQDLEDPLQPQVELWNAIRVCAQPGNTRAVRLHAVHAE